MLESELFSLFTHAGDAVYVVRANGTVCFWNAAATRLFGYSAGEAVGRDIEELLEGRDVLGTSAIAGGSESATRTRQRDARTIPNFDLEVRTRRGTRRWVNVSTIVFDNARTGERLFVRLARDIDQVKRTQDLLARAVEMSRELVARADGETDNHAPTQPLSERERTILRLFAAGSSAATVARTLAMSGQTLRNHLHRINAKLRTHSRLEAVTHALRRGLID